jgi:uncharacterized membrane protein YcaP (DUF421 family)
MESIIRGIVVYVFLLVIFRVAGNRTLAQTTSFDFVLLLIISETTQQAMVDADHSITNGFLLIITLVGLSILMSVLKIRFPRFEKWIDGLPVVVLEHGKPLHQRMKKIRIDEADILTSARMYHGLERLDQIKYAIVEHSGEITIVPKEK